MEEQNNYENVTISRERYNELLRLEEVLNALESAGVDNWEGYDYAISHLRGSTKN
jgi:hypothetical protein